MCLAHTVLIRHGYKLEFDWVVRLNNRHLEGITVLLYG